MATKSARRHSDQGFDRRGPEISLLLDPSLAPGLAIPGERPGDINIGTGPRPVWQSVSVSTDQPLVFTTQCDAGPGYRVPRARSFRIGAADRLPLAWMTLCAPGLARSASRCWHERVGRRQRRRRPWRRPDDLCRPDQPECALCSTRSRELARWRCCPLNEMASTGLRDGELKMPIVLSIRLF